MSPVDPKLPEVGEEIHLPGGSIQPLLLAVGITIALVGVTTSIVAVVLGLVLTVWVLIRWIVDARREMAELPIHEPGEHH
jgi:hypothetical protein